MVQVPTDCGDLWCTNFKLLLVKYQNHFTALEMPRSASSWIPSWHHEVRCASIIPFSQMKRKFCSIKHSAQDSINKKWRSLKRSIWLLSLSYMRDVYSTPLAFHQDYKTYEAFWACLTLHIKQSQGPKAQHNFFFNAVEYIMYKCMHTGEKSLRGSANECLHITSFREPTL